MVGRRLVVMGVSAAGKSTVGRAVAAELGLPFLDADDFHTDDAVRRMARGEALDDADREPWLRACGSALAELSGGAVMACSALARRYRRILVEECPDAVFVFLRVDEHEAKKRSQDREGHFMSPALLRSQFATLEPLEREEGGLTVDADQPFSAVVRAIVEGASSAAAPQPRAYDA